MSIEQAFSTFTDLLSELEDGSLIQEIENHFKDIWADEYYAEKQLSIESLKDMGVTPLHSQVYDSPYPDRMDDNVLVVVFDSDKNRGIVMDGNHRHNTHALSGSSTVFKVLIFYVEIPWSI